jgi:hypothetical protein
MLENAMDDRLIQVPKVLNYAARPMHSTENYREISVSISVSRRRSLPVALLTAFVAGASAGRLAQNVCQKPPAENDRPPNR